MVWHAAQGQGRGGLFPAQLSKMPHLPQHTCGIIEAHEETKQRGFAAAGRSYQCEDVTRRTLESGIDRNWRFLL